jgi:hypothetical protein
MEEGKVIQNEERRIRNGRWIGRKMDRNQKTRKNKKIKTTKKKAGGGGH